MDRPEISARLSVEYVSWINQQLRDSIEESNGDVEIRRQGFAGRLKAYFLTGISVAAYLMLQWLGW